MPVRPSHDIPSEAVPAGAGITRKVLIGPDEGPNFALRKFTMEPGGGMPLHTNTVEHEQYVLRGRARVVIGEEVLEVKKDDTVFIPGGVPHSYDSSQFPAARSRSNTPVRQPMLPAALPSSPTSTVVHSTPSSS